GGSRPAELAAGKAAAAATPTRIECRRYLKPNNSAVPSSAVSPAEPIIPPPIRGVKCTRERKTGRGRVCATRPDSCCWGLARQDRLADEGEATALGVDRGVELAVDRAGVAGVPAAVGLGRVRVE